MARGAVRQNIDRAKWHGFARFRKWAETLLLP